MMPKTKLFSASKRKSKCKYKRTCSLFSDASYTCTHTGGKYCGKYRALTQAQDDSAIKTSDFLIPNIVTQ